LRLELGGAGEVVEGVARVVAFGEEQAEGVVGLGAVGFLFQDGAKVRFGGIGVAAGRKDFGEAEAGFEVVGMALDDGG
jgi:hypothetical protein